MQGRAVAAARAMLLAAGLALAAPGAALAQRVADAAHQEIEGRINGQPARLLANGDDVLVSVAEADRLGLAFRDAKALSIGGTPLWLVILNAVTVNGQTRVGVQAGIVPSIPGYFAALRAHPGEAIARSREVRAEINGMAVTAYDLGDGGVLLSIAEAERVGLRYREGQRRDVGGTPAWTFELPVKIGAAPPRPTALTVAEPEAFFESMLAGAGATR